MNSLRSANVNEMKRSGHFKKLQNRQIRAFIDFIRYVVCDPNKKEPFSVIVMTVLNGSFGLALRHYDFTVTVIVSLDVSPAALTSTPRYS